jgi:putative hydrolase of the HAD superfamily
MSGTVLWDFDGTLAHRPGMWAGCLVETLDEHEPGHGIRADDLRPFLRSGFPWHEPQRPHPELVDADAWWAHTGSALERAYASAGIEPGRAASLAALVRHRYVDATVAWTVYPDTVPVLRALRDSGWRHVVLSNHVPELGRIVEALGLAGLLDEVVNSAEIGYEKPHPEAFAHALRVAGGADWMVGDSYDADVVGGEAAGLRAILVRRPDARASRFAPGLAEAAALLS